MPSTHPAFTSQLHTLFRKPSSTPYRPSNRQNRSKCFRCAAESLEEAVTLGYVQPFGRTIQLDKNGRFPRDNVPQIPTQLKVQLGGVVNIIVRQVKSVALKAIFLRGSVATGFWFRDGRSDLDLIVVTSHPLPESEINTVRVHASKVAKHDLGVAGADIRFIHQDSTSRRLLESESRYAIILLQHYGVLLYGSNDNLFPFVDVDEPGDELAVDIRRDERTFLHVFSEASTTDDFHMRCNAIQWMCKRALRAVVDLSSRVTKRHSRDLFPCYKLASEAHQEHGKTFLLGLQCACASAENKYLGLSKPEFLRLGYRTARNLVEIVEDLSLVYNFGPVAKRGGDKLQTPDNSVLPSQTFVQRLGELTEEFVASVVSSAPRMRRVIHANAFARTQLPVLSQEFSSVTSSLEDVDVPAVTTACQLLITSLGKPGTPVVARDCLRKLQRNDESTATILNGMLGKHRRVECRVSPGNEVTFCRRTHPWVDSKKFTPPSVSISLPLPEAITRMKKGCTLPPLIYTRSAREHIYIQTLIHQSEQLFDVPQTECRLAQRERIWISTHGTVSGLHYDASYSILLQRTGMKRMIFFPRDCLPYMGIYPRGHPLHRRARVNLCRSETDVFEAFWDICACKAMQVVLGPGDLVAFPPFWAHYTESMADGPLELSVSHTVRYL